MLTTGLAYVARLSRGYVRLAYNELENTEMVFRSVESSHRRQSSREPASRASRQGLLELASVSHV